LHIGETSDLRRRVGFFQNAAAGGAAPHQAGWNFNNYRYERLFPLPKLCLDYRVTRTKPDARALEHQLHEQYQFRFLDRPPLDAQG
jgi:hypothetical protein